jgi:hypothetical protein
MNALKIKYLFKLSSTFANIANVDWGLKLVCIVVVFLFVVDRIDLKEYLSL